MNTTTTAATTTETIKGLDFCGTDFQAKIVFFTQEMTGSVSGVWNGNLTASEQRALFGRVLGKGKITIDGLRGEVFHTKRIAWGNDYDATVWAIASF